MLTSDAVPLGVAFVGGPVLLLLGGLLGYVGVIAMRSALPRNGRLGIRTPNTLASDAAWDAAHRAGGPWIIGAALGAVVPGAVALYRPANTTFTLIAMIGFGLMVALVAVASLAANAAAEATELESDPNERPETQQIDNGAGDGPRSGDTPAL